MANLSEGTLFIVIFIGAIIAITFMAPIADSVIGQTSTVFRLNDTVTASSVNVSLDLVGREIVGDAIVTNATDGEELAGTTVATVTSATTGLLTVGLTIDDANSTYAGQAVNVSYTMRPDGYLNLGGARGVNLLIPIMAALAILIFIIVMLIKTGSLGVIMNKFK